MENYDVISARKNWLCASFALFRNNSQINNLFKLSKDWENVFRLDKVCRFTEFGCGNVQIIKELSSGKSIHDLDPIKLKIEYESFTHILTNKQKVKDIALYFEDIILEEIQKGMIILSSDYGICIYNKGNSLNRDDHQFLHYHFVINKESCIFKFPKWEKIPKEFFISRYGFIKHDKLKYLKLFKPFILIRGFLMFPMKKIPQIAKKVKLKLLGKIKPIQVIIVC